MSPWTKFVRGAAAAVLCAWPMSILAQQENTEKPKPAARDYSPFPDVTSQQPADDQGSQNMQPDNGPLTGVQNPTLGTAAMRHSYWVPGIQYGNTFLSNSVNSGSSDGGWNSVNYVTGNVSLLEGWRRSLLAVNYTGGGYFSTDSTQGSGQFQQFALGYQLQARRFQFLLMDQFAYLPESSFGFGASTGLSVPGIGGTLGVSVPGLQGGYSPGQSIATAFGPRYTNAATAQLTYELTKRSSITIAGIFGTLRFVEAGNIPSNNPTAVFGYNYQITKKDTIGVSYRFSAYQYPGDPQALGDHSAQVAYGRKLTGRLAMQVAGGPDITTFRVPIGSTSRRVSGSGNASLIYAFKRSSVSVNYLHGVSGGSGVFVGATSDQVGASVNRVLSRVWQANANFSYARNGQVASPSGLPAARFNTWYAGAGVSRALGRDANFSLAYQAQVQDAGVAICTGLGCGATYTQHQIALSFQWHTRPLVIR